MANLPTTVPTTAWPYTSEPARWSRPPRNRGRLAGQGGGALAAAGGPVEQLPARGHFHSSFTMVDMIATAVSGREKWRKPCSASPA